MEKVEFSLNDMDDYHAIANLAKRRGVPDSAISYKTSFWGIKLVVSKEYESEVEHAINEYENLKSQKNSNSSNSEDK